MKLLYSGELNSQTLDLPGHPSSGNVPTRYAIVPVTICGIRPDGSRGPAQDEQAMIDTGATTSAIHPDLSEGLGVDAVSREEGMASGDETPVEVPVFHVAIAITSPAGDIRAEWRPNAVELPLPYPDLFRVIIGTDILAGCQFTYNGTAGRIINFPGLGNGPIGEFRLEIPES
jgi:hypothetical protein